jgi:hypothetical protein
MPRIGREQSVTGIYHVMLRGINRQDIFEEAEDYGRIGHLFQDRFKSEPCNDSQYFMTLFRYIHQNPVKAALVSQAEDYEYSSWGNDYLGKASQLVCQTQPALKRYGIAELAEWVNPDTPIENMVLSAEAYSNIFSNVLSQMEGEDKVDNLYNNKVSVGVTFCDEDIKSQFNSPVLQERDNALTEHVGTGVKVSAKVNYGGNGDNRFLFSTVSNIQNLLGIHEYKGHGIKRWGNANKRHYDVYLLQMNHPTWKKTTKEFKQTQIENSNQYK